MGSEDFQFRFNVASWECLTVGDDDRIFPLDSFIGNSFRKVYREQGGILEMTRPIWCFEEDFGSSNQHPKLKIRI